MLCAWGCGEVRGHGAIIPVVVIGAVELVKKQQKEDEVEGDTDDEGRGDWPSPSWLVAGMVRQVVVVHHTDPDAWRVSTAACVAWLFSVMQGGRSWSVDHSQSIKHQKQVHHLHLQDKCGGDQVFSICAGYLRVVYLV